MFFAPSSEKLSPSQHSLLRRLVPWAEYCNRQTANKALFFKHKSFVGILPSLLMSEIIYKTDWGESPLSQDRFRGKDANNLLLLTVDEVWEGEKTRYKSVEYKMFTNWTHFFVHYSDLLVFVTSSILDCNTYESQLAHLSPNMSYNEEIQRIVNLYDLRRFDGATKTI